ncbi:MAG: SPASM domain-containing protein, partial [Candidatus Nanoarchaeia archaeon]
NNCSIQVSIDGLTKEQHDEIRGKGNFNKTISTLKRLSESEIYTTVHFVVHKLNYPTNTNQLESFLNILQAVSVKEVTFSRLVPIGTGKQMRELLLSSKEVRMLFRRLIEVSQNFPTLYLNTSRPLWAILKECAGGVCPVGFRACTILPNGDVLPCRRLPIVIGNLKNQSFFEIWYKSDVLWRLRERKKIEVCGKCKFLDQCAGCRAIAYAVYGDFMAKDPQCFIHHDEVSKL